MITITRPNMTLFAEDGTQVSRHRSEVEAMESAAAHGPGVYRLDRPAAEIVVKAPDTAVKPEEPAKAPAPEPPPAEDPTPKPAPSSGLSAEYLGRGLLEVGDFGGEKMRPVSNDGAFCVRNGVISIASHEHRGAVGRYGLIRLSKAENAPIIPNVRDFMPFPKPAGNERWLFQGLYEDAAGQVFATAVQYYDAAPPYNKNALAILNPSGVVSDWYPMAGDARGAGWIQEVPMAWRQRLGGSHLYGSASNTPVNGRHSHGPSLYAWDGTLGGAATAKNLLFYPMDKRLAVGGYAQEEAADPLWNDLAEARTGFIWGDDYIVVGRQGGLESGIVYKKPGSNGYSPNDDNDYCNYFWRYRLDDILAAENVWGPRPYDYGKLNLECGPVDGAYFDDQEGVLYTLSYNDRSRTRQERYPTIYGFKVTR